MAQVKRTVFLFFIEIDLDSLHCGPEKEKLPVIILIIILQPSRLINIRSGVR